MPEGDTVWLASQRMNRALAGQGLTRGEFRVPHLAVLDLAGQTVTEVVSRGKHMLFRFTDGHTLRSDFRMDGSWRIHASGQPWRGGPAFTVRAVLCTGRWECVGYRLHDLAYVPTANEDSLVGDLGPDVLGPEWDLDEAVARLRLDGEAEIGVALLDQRNCAGIGTLYRTEGLFLAGIRPQRRVADIEPNKLPAVVDRMRRLMMINRDHPEQSTTGSTRRGETHWAFERDRRPCRRCGTTIQRGEQGPEPHQRVTYWCPTCQA